MLSIEYDELNFSSLFGELEKDSFQHDTGVKGTPYDSYEVSTGDLLQDLDPLGDQFADWMTEKIDFSLLDQTDDLLQPESTIGIELADLLAPKGEEASLVASLDGVPKAEDVNLEVGPDDLELLTNLVTANTPEENQIPDLGAPSPTSSMCSDDTSRSASPTITDITKLDIIAASNIIDTMPASNIMAQLVQFQQNKVLSDNVIQVPEHHLTPPLSPTTSSSDLESIPVVKDTKKREAPKRARSKVKNASGSKIIDKKSRKRDQNKLAATRYREKKRGELQAVQEEEDVLVKRNKELLEEVETLSREIKYMKDLMVDVYKAKGQA